MQRENSLVFPQVIWSVVSSTHKTFERKWTLRQVTWMKKEETVVFPPKKVHDLRSISVLSYFIITLNSEVTVKNNPPVVPIPMASRPPLIPKIQMTDGLLHTSFTKVLVKILPLLQKISHQKFSVVVLQPSNTQSHSTHYIASNLIHMQNTMAY